MNNSSRGKGLGEWSAIVLPLLNRLVEENGSTDGLVEARRFENQLPVLTVGLRNLRYIPFGEPLIAGSGAFVDR